MFSLDFSCFFNFAILFNVVAKIRKNTKTSPKLQNKGKGYIYLQSIACILWEDSIFAKISQKCTRLRTVIYIYVFTCMFQKTMSYLYIYINSFRWVCIVFNNIFAQSPIYIYIYTIINSIKSLRNLCNFAKSSQFCEICAISQLYFAKSSQFYKRKFISIFSELTTSFISS